AIIFLADNSGSVTRLMPFPFVFGVRHKYGAHPTGIAMSSIFALPSTNLFDDVAPDRSAAPSTLGDLLLDLFDTLEVFTLEVLSNHANAAVSRQLLRAPSS